jgi:hypothetical protein
MNLLSTTEPLEGILLIQKVYAGGEKETIFEKKNLITVLGKQQMLLPLYSASLTPDPITTLKVGTGGTIDPAGLYPKTVASSLTNLYTTLMNVTCSYTLNTAVPSITFISDLNQGDANGSLITEAGLFKQSGAMFNIKTFPGIAKSSEFALHFEWTIKIA